MLRRKLILSVLLGLVTLTVAPAVLGAVRSPAGAGPGFEQGRPELRRLGGEGPILSGQNLRIGASVAGGVTIANTGGASARYSLSAVTSGGDAFASRLVLTVVRSADSAVVYSGPLDALGSLNLGKLASGASEHLALRISLPTTGSARGDNELQGSVASVVFRWSSLQA